MSLTKERDKSKKRMAILKGAEEVFIGFGYESASMDDIAKVAGVSKKTVYNHFGSKEVLFETIVGELLNERKNLTPIVYNKKQPLTEQLIAFAESEIHLIDSKRRLDLSRFLTLTFLRDLEFQKTIVAKHPPAAAILVTWLQAAKEDGRIQTDNVLLTAQVFYAMVIGGITWPALFRDELNKEQIMPLLNELVSVFLARYEVKKCN